MEREKNARRGIQKLPGLRWKTAKGKRYAYVIPKGGSTWDDRIKIAAPEGTDEFERECLAAYISSSSPHPVVGEKVQRLRKVGDWTKITYSEAVERCVRSPEFVDHLGKCTHSHYRRYLRKLGACLEMDMPLGAITYDGLVDILADQSPDTQRQVISAFRFVFRWVNKQARIAKQKSLPPDPSRDFPYKKKVENDGFQEWPEWAIEIYREKWALGTLQRTMLELAYESGQRGGDQRSLLWSHIVDSIEDGRARKLIPMRQGKTNNFVLVVVSAILWEALMAWKATCEKRFAELALHERREDRFSYMPPSKVRENRRATDHILRTMDQMVPLSYTSYHDAWRKGLKGAGLPTFKKGEHSSFETVFSAHGLRKAGGCEVASATNGDLAATMNFFGHAEVKTTLRYLKRWDRKRLSLQTADAREEYVRQKASKKAARNPGELIPLKGKKAD